LRTVYPIVPLRKDLQSPFAQSGVSNTVLREGFAQKALQFHSCFSLHMTKECHATDGHNENLQTEESLVEPQFA